MTSSQELILVEIQGIALDPNSRNPIVLLRDPGTGFNLPIWIGLMEAAAISSVLEGVTPPRPMTHDLLANVATALEASVEYIAITELQSGTFYAIIHLDTREGPIDIDARPSDSIALALRAGAPIYVARPVFEESAIPPAEDLDAPGDEELDEMGVDSELQKDLREMDPEERERFLENLPRKGFGKYKM